MHAARLVQWILLGLASLGFVILLVLFAKLAFETPFDPAEADEGWMEALAAVPGASEPADYQDEFEFGFGGDDPAPGAEAFFNNSNRFVAHSAILMVTGLVGYGLIIAAIARRPSGRFAPLAVLGAGGIILLGNWLFGFNTAYPMEFALGGLLPDSPGGPVLADEFLNEDPFEYGLAFTLWTDFLYQAAFAISSGCFVIGLMAGRYRTPIVVLAAVLTGCLGFPLATLWLWGAGWLSDLGAVDFGGGGNVHLLAGGVGLGLVVLARLCPPRAPWQMHTMNPATPNRREVPSQRLSPLSLTVFIAGIVGFLLLPLGMQAGSVLALDTPVVASVLHNTFMCLGGSVVAGAVVSIPLAIRPRSVTVLIAAIAGLAAIAAPGDVLNGMQSLVLGIVAGAIAALLSWTFERYRFDDPLGLVAAHLVGGFLGMVAAGVIGPDASVVVQLVAAIAFTGLGITIGACVGLLGWLIGLLWTSDDLPQPPPLADKAMTSTAQ